MAIYEYSCLKCGHNFEVWQRITEEPLKVCDKCGGELVRLIGQTGFILKGTGWYVTDYARKGKNSETKKETTKETENSN